jgi:hypothetical protein
MCDDSRISMSGQGVPELVGWRFRQNHEAATDHSATPNQPAVRINIQTAED